MSTALEIMAQPLSFQCGLTMKNRFMLAPMTNCQSHEDGTLSEDEFHWLVKRAKGQFGLVMTCASHVHPQGKGFPGQLGIFSDQQIASHQKLTTALRHEGSLSIIQLFHAGMRSPKNLIGEQPWCPSENEKFGARAVTLEEVHQIRDDFILSAIRAKESGYDGVEIHGAHGYIISQFLSKEINLRRDEYGGVLKNRSRLLIEIIKGIQEACGKDFCLGVRLSPERFGMDLNEIKTISKQLIELKIDFLDISLWDVFKMPDEEKYQHLSLLEHFSSIERGSTRLTVAGKIFSKEAVTKTLDHNIDFISIGRAGILHHDFPIRVMNETDFISTKPPVSVQYLKYEGLGDAFIEYMRRWPKFVLD